MREVQLSNLCDMRSGGTPSRKNLSFYGGDIPWAKIGDLETSSDGLVTDTEEKITFEGLANIRNIMFPKGTLLLAMYGSVGKTAFAGTNLATNQAILGIRIKNKNELDAKYLSYWFKTIKERLGNRAVGGTLQNISLTIVKGLKIPLPPLATQKKIATILDAADAHRQKTKQLLAKYDELAQSIFLEMFGDPVTNPKGWEVKKLGDLGNWKSGGTPTRQNPNFFDGNIPWLSSGELEEMYVQKSKEFITQEAINDSAAKIIEEGSLLLGMYDTAALKSTITTFACSCNQAIAFAMLNPQIVNTEFVFTQIQQAKEHFRRLQRGVRQKNLNLSMVKDIRIMVPPIDLQTHYAEILKGVRKQRQSLQNSLLLSENLFNNFLQNAFNGELV